MELENEHHQHSETLKAMKRQERRLRELCIASQEGKSDQQKLYEALEKLQQKLRFYKRQVDELVSNGDGRWRNCVCIVCILCRDFLGGKFRVPWP